MRVVCLWRGPGVCVCERACARRHCHPRLPPRRAAARRGPGYWAEDLGGLAITASVCLSVRLYSQILSQASPLQTLPPLRRLLPRPQARSQTHATGRGPRWALALLQLQRPVRWLHRGPPSPGHPPSAPPRPRPTSATSLRPVSQFTPPPPPPAHSTAGGKVAPGAAPRCFRTTSSPTRSPSPSSSPHAPFSACALTRCSARNHWRALRWGCCVPILQAGQLRRVSRVLAQS